MTKPYLSEQEPIDVRRIAATIVLEGYLRTGGLPQLVWEEGHDWEILLKMAREGYELFGAVKQADQIADIRKRCKRQVRPAQRAHRYEDEHPEVFDVFETWKSEVEGTLCDSDDDILLNQDLDDMRNNYLENHFHSV